MIPPGRARLHELMLLETIEGSRIGGLRTLEEEEGRREGSSRGTAIREKRIIDHRFVLVQCSLGRDWMLCLVVHDHSCLLFFVCLFCFG